MYDTEFLVLRITQCRGGDHEDPVAVYGNERNATLWVETIHTHRAAGNYDSVRALDPDWDAASYYEVRHIKRGD